MSAVGDCAVGFGAGWCAWGGRGGGEDGGGGDHKARACVLLVRRTKVCCGRPSLCGRGASSCQCHLRSRRCRWARRRQAGGGCGEGGGGSSAGSDRMVCCRGGSVRHIAAGRFPEMT